MFRFTFTRGVRAKDKLKLATLGLLHWLFRLVKLPSSCKQLIIDKLYRKTIVKIGNVYFILIDSESYAIIDPNYEHNVQHLLLSSVKEDDVFIDVGAHIGKYTVMVGKSLMRGLVIALEPDIENFLFLLKNIKLNRLTNVLLYPIAAYNKKRYIKLYLRKGFKGRSSVKRASDWYTTVPALPLDYIVHMLRLNKVDWIKIDIEGAEVEVLEGALNILKKYRPKLIIEVSTENTRNVFSLLFKYGYRFRILERRSTHYMVFAYSRS